MVTQPKLKVADLPDPPTLTADDYQRIDDEAKRWRDAFKRQTSDMEILTSEDLRTLVR